MSDMKEKTATATRKKNTTKAGENDKGKTAIPPKKTAPPIKEKPIVAKSVNPEEYVFVINGFPGKLTYISSRTGEKFVWADIGDVQEIQLRELRGAKNSSKSFFSNNWFMFEEDWIIDYLGVRQYYKNSINIEGFDDLFKKPIGDIKKTINSLSKGQKKSAMYRAMELISLGEIDSLKTITLLEDLFGVDLIEK